MSLLYNSIYRHQKYNTVSNVLTVLVEYLKLYTGIAAVPVRVISPPLSKNCPDDLWPTAEEAVYTQWIRPLELIFTSGRTRPACWPDGQLAGVSRMALGRGGYQLSRVAMSEVMDTTGCMWVLAMYEWVQDTSMSYSSPSLLLWSSTEALSQPANRKTTNN